jgi:hypothetical protein
MQDQQEAVANSAHIGRQAYIAPALTVFGGLAELTAAGSGGSSESVGSDMICGPTFMFNQNCGM